MAKLYRVKFIPENLIILNGNTYFADQEYEAVFTDKQGTALKNSMKIISSTLIGEEPDKTNKTETKKSRPSTKRG
jgi:hypothetical protein